MIDVVKFLSRLGHEGTIIYKCDNNYEKLQQSHVFWLIPKLIGEICDKA
jgi:hypothetical protein